MSIAEAFLLFWISGLEISALSTTRIHRIDFCRTHGLFSLDVRSREWILKELGISRMIDVRLKKFEFKEELICPKNSNLL